MLEVSSDSFAEVARSETYFRFLQVGCGTGAFVYP